MGLSQRLPCATPDTRLGEGRVRAHNSSPSWCCHTHTLKKEAPYQKETNHRQGLIRTLSSGVR